MNVEDNHRVYEGEDAFLRLPTSFGKSVRYEVLSLFTCLTVQSELCTGRDSYAVILLVSPLGSLTFCCSSFFSCVCILLSKILPVYCCTWTIYINVTILRKYSRNWHACTSSRYQAVFLLPRGLGTRLYRSLSRMYRSMPCNMFSLDTVCHPFFLLLSRTRTKLDTLQ